MADQDLKKKATIMSYHIRLDYKLHLCMPFTILWTYPVQKLNHYAIIFNITVRPTKIIKWAQFSKKLQPYNTHSRFCAVPFYRHFLKNSCTVEL